MTAAFAYRPTDTAFRSIPRHTKCFGTFLREAIQRKIKCEPLQSKFCSIAWGSGLLQIFGSKHSTRISSFAHCAESVLLTILGSDFLQLPYLAKSLP